MHDYRHLEAYQLTRSLVAGVCSFLPETSAPELRHAAVAAAAHIADGTLKGDRGSVLEHLEAARRALGEVAALIAAARLSGSLPPTLAEALLLCQAQAAEALQALRDSAVGPALPGSQLSPPEPAPS